MDGFFAVLTRLIIIRGAVNLQRGMAVEIWDGNGA